MIVEKLDISQKAEILGVLKQAFATHPMMPSNTPIEKTEAMLELMLDSFGSAGRAYLYGIRKEGKLACVSFSVDAHYEPKGMAVIQLFYRFFRIMGWQLTRKFISVYAKRPKYADPYLDLTFLGTLPDYHGQGMGRTMLRFLYGFARENEYHGIILAVAKDTPPYHFYHKEGFTVDKDIPFGDMFLSYMRKE